MKLTDQLYKITAAMGAVVLALGIGVGTNVLSLETPPLFQKQVLIEDSADPLAPEPPGPIRTAKLIYDDLSGARQEMSMHLAEALELPTTHAATLYLEIDTSQTIDNKVEITIPEGLIALDYPEAKEMPALVSKLDLSEFATGNYSGYVPQSGTLTYYVTDAASHLTLELVIGKDPAFWNSLMLDEIDNPLTVRLYSGEGASVQVHDTASIDVNIVASQINNNYLRVYGSSTGVPAASGKENRFSVRVLRVQCGGYSKEFSVTMALPKDTKTGKYAKFDTVGFPGFVNRQYGLDPSTNTGCTFETSVDDTKHTVTFTWKNLYLESYDFIRPYFYWEEGDQPADGDPITYYSENIPHVVEYGPAGSVATAANECVAGAKRVLVDGTVLLLENGYMANQPKADGTTTNPVTSKNATATAACTTSIRSRYDVNRYATDPDLVYCLGGLRMRNANGVDTNPRTVRYAYHNTDKFGIVMQLIPVAPGGSVTVRYKTTAHPDTFTEHPTALRPGTAYYVKFDSGMAGLAPGEYFTEIEADIGVVPRDFIGYNEIIAADAWDGGAVFGKIITSGVANGQYDIASCWWKDTDKVSADTVSPVVGSLTCKFTLMEGSVAGLGLVADYDTAGNEIPMYSKKAVTGGETIRISALVSLATGSDIGQAHVIDDPIICLRLPEGITVDNLKLERVVGSRSDAVYISDGFEAMRDTSGTPVSTLIAASDYQVSAPVAMADGCSLQTITFKNGAGRIGWLDMADRSQTQIRISGDLSVDPAISSSSMNIRTTLLVRSASLAAYTGTGFHARSKVEDTFGVTEELVKRGLLNRSVGLASVDLMSGETGNGGTSEPVYLSSCASTYENRNLIIKAARGGNAPTVSVGVNGGTATTGTQALLMADANGDVTLPPAPVKEGKTFEGWVASDGNTYQANAKMHVGVNNVTIAAKWSDETAPAPDVLKPFEYTLNESGVNYGGTGTDMNADASGEVPAAIAQRAGGSTGKIAVNGDDENGDDNANGNTATDEPGDNATTLPPGDNYLDDPPDLDGEGPEDPNGNGEEPGDDNPNGRVGDEGPNGDDPNGDDPNGTGSEDPNGTAGDGTDGSGQGDPTGGATRIGSGTGSGSGSTSTTSGGKGYDSGSPLASTSDNVPIAVILCTAGVALLLASLVLFRMQARARLAEAAESSTGHVALTPTDDDADDFE